MEPEHRWMEAVAAGDEAAFEQLIARHSSVVLNTIRRFVGDTGRAEELTQEVFLRVWRAAPRYEPTAAFRTWLFTIVRRLCWNELRRVGREVSIDEELGEGPSPGGIARLASEEPLPEDRLLSAERATAVRAAIQDLPPGPADGSNLPTIRGAFVRGNCPSAGNNGLGGKKSSGSSTPHLGEAPCSVSGEIMDKRHETFTSLWGLRD